VYEKNLGKDTDELAKAMTEFNPDKSWHVGWNHWHVFPENVPRGMAPRSEDY
jgi:hypothetical protein